MSFNKLKTPCAIVACCVMSTFLLGCMSKEVGYSDQQKRMVRCDQYIGNDREECLRGMAVTIEDYKADYREFERDEQKKRDAADKKQLEQINKSIPVVVDPPQNLKQI